MLYYGRYDVVVTIVNSMWYSKTCSCNLPADRID